MKPNLFELESTFGVTFSNPEEIISFCRKNFLSQKIICVSMGKDGAVLVTRDNAFFRAALDVPAKGLAGAGDAMVAGLVYALAKNLQEEEFLPTAMATAAASVILEGTQMCTHEGFLEMFKLIES